MRGIGVDCAECRARERSTSVTDLTLEARNLLDLVHVIDGYDGPINDAVFAAWSRIEAARAQLAIALAILARRLAESMSGKRYTVDGVGTFEATGSPTASYWEQDLVSGYSTRASSIPIPVRFWMRHRCRRCSPFGTSARRGSLPCAGAESTPMSGARSNPEP